VEDHHYNSEDVDKWTWICLAGLLVLAVVVAFVSLGIMSNNQAMQSQTPTQTVPAK
jgi:hypothetical protein